MQAAHMLVQDATHGLAEARCTPRPRGGPQVSDCSHATTARGCIILTIDRQQCQWRATPASPVTAGARSPQGKRMAPGREHGA